MRVSSITPPITGKLNTNHPLARGLVGHWTLNEGGGQLAFDAATGGINNGSLQNGSAWKQTARGNAILFDGSNDLVTIANNSAIQIENDITLSAWVYIVSFPHTFNQIIMKNNANTGYYGMLVNSSGKFLFQKPSISPTSTTTLTTGVWYHLLATCQGNGGTGNCKLYINGVLDATSGTSATAFGTSTAALQFGADAVNAGRQGNILLNDVKIYNRALSYSEIRQLYTSPYCMYSQRVNNSIQSQNVTNTNFLLMF